jgi:hypothetical protein
MLVRAARLAQQTLELLVGTPWMAHVSVDLSDYIIGSVICFKSANEKYLQYELVTELIRSVWVLFPS